ncbi:MAG: serine protease [Bacteriovoracaceae bacterium]|jgi:S1-C subfamily serine protease|nr:serine protease [Bacteriovoracaceae bacterium]
MKAIVTLFIPILALSKSYQVGKTWSKVHINKASSTVQVLKESVGEVGARATLFYIGKINNKHYAITNNHVCPNKEKPPYKIKNRCENQWIKFFYYKNEKGESLQGKIKNVPFIDKSLDLALLEISFSNLTHFKRAPTALKLSDKKPYFTQKLISIGYGAHNNEYGVLMVEEDSFECQVFSKEIKFVKDPDTFNPIDYKVYSFLHGCDVSHGDSGSPILDRYTYEVVGLLWTGKYPKNDEISSEGFENLSIEFLWKELNYASASFMIKDILEAFFKKSL